MARWYRSAAAALIVLLVSTLTPAGASARPVKSPWPDDAVPGSLLVTMSSDPDAEALARRNGGRAYGRVVHLEVGAGNEAAVAARLRDLDGVIDVEPSRWRQAFRTPNDLEYDEQWSHEIARAAAAWDIETGDRAIEVAVIDSGIEGTHADLRPNLVKQVDVSGGTVEQRPLGSDNDACDFGHGTAVAGVIGAVGNNGAGVAGVAWEVGIVDVATSDPFRCGLFSDTAILAALDYVADRGVDVANLSLGGPGDTCPTAMQAAITRARSRNVVVVAAAGNEQEILPGLTSIPASCNGVVSVGAVGDTGEVAPYSNRNAHVDVAAPGGDMANGRGILTTAGSSSRTEEVEGTSFAAPYVAGVAALLRANRPTLSPDQIEALLEGTAQRIGVSHSSAIGWGVVDAGRALAAASNPPASRPEPTFPVGLVVRVSPQEATTDPVTQAVAMSQFIFRAEDVAEYAVVARADDFADALAGSSLAFGVAPVLFAHPTGGLPAATRRELRRVLPEGATVYLLGGSAALSPGLEAELDALGFNPERVAGPNREATAAAGSRATEERLDELGAEQLPMAILATGYEWPDAVTAGSIGSWFGVPILLTGSASLGTAARDELARLRPDRVYVIGGTAAVSDATADQARAAAADAQVVRLAGTDRNNTAAAVASELRRLLQVTAGIDAQVAVGVNLRRNGGFAHVLSASMATGAVAGIFLAVDGQNGEQIPAVTAEVACSLEPFIAVVAGDADVVAEATKLALNDLLEHRTC